MIKLIRASFQYENSDRGVQDLSLIHIFMGGVVLVLSDIAARMINAPFDTPVGALVSILGVPVFFALTFRKEGMVL